MAKQGELAGNTEWYLKEAWGSRTDLIYFANNSPLLQGSQQFNSFLAIVAAVYPQDNDIVRQLKNTTYGRQYIEEVFSAKTNAANILVGKDLGKVLKGCITGNKLDAFKNTLSSPVAKHIPARTLSWCCARALDQGDRLFPGPNQYLEAVLSNTDCVEKIPTAPGGYEIFNRSLLSLAQSGDPNTVKAVFGNDKVSNNITEYVVEKIVQRSADKYEQGYNKDELTYLLRSKVVLKKTPKLFAKYAEKEPKTAKEVLEKNVGITAKSTAVEAFAKVSEHATKDGKVDLEVAASLIKVMGTSLETNIEKGFTAEALAEMKTHPKRLAVHMMDEHNKQLGKDVKPLEVANSSMVKTVKTAIRRLFNKHLDSNNLKHTATHMQAAFLKQVSTGVVGRTSTPTRAPSKATGRQL